MFIQIERHNLKASDHVIVITEDFLPVLTRWGIESHKVSVIENWGPIDEIQMLPKENYWALQKELHNKTCIVYSGTLGLKHDPRVLMDIALHYRDRAEISTVIVSEGIGANYLLQKIREHKLQNAMVLPFQAFSDLSAVLSTADVLVALLEKDSAVYSVPSKVLTYICSNKPVVVSAPSDNLICRILKESNAGYCVEPGNSQKVIDKIDSLLHDRELRMRLGNNGRSYAEKRFRIGVITEKFSYLFKQVRGGNR